MKIHTTQNLKLFNNKISANQPELKTDYALSTTINNRMSAMNHSDSYEHSVSFKGKKPKTPKNPKDILPKIAKRIKDTTSKRASDKKGMTEKVLSSARFNNMLRSILDNEVITNASIAFLIGWLCRVPTILALPEWLGGKHKEDKAMAAAHSGASVSMGIVTALLLTLPINKAAAHARENLYHKIKPELLKKRHPQLDLDSIKDSTGKILEKKFWKDTSKNIFDTNIKTPMTVARPKFCGDIAESTYKSLGIDIDMAKNAGKSVQEMTLRDGRKLVDVLTPKDMFIAIEEEGMGTTLKGLKDTNFFSLEYIDKDFLSKSMPELDIKTAFVDGKITHPNTWKTKEGKSAFNFDVYLSNYLETAESTPVYTGAKRYESDGTAKYKAYQNNGVDGGLGTEITTEMILRDKNIDTTNKIVGWALDVATKVPVGLCTVALIPKILNVFDSLDKRKQSKISADNMPKNIENKTDKDGTSLVSESKTSANGVSFKGKKPDKVTNWLSKNYVLKLLNSDRLQKFVEGFDKKFSKSMTEIMTIAGSFVMSSSYVVGTLTNKNFKDKKDRRNTLAINQGLGFVVPTIIGSWVTSKIGPKVKTATYNFVGQQNQRIKLMAQKGQITKEAEEKALKTVARAAKGIPVLASLTVFTFIYRYFTPVAVTPIANFLGNKLSEMKHKQKQEPENTNTKEPKVA